jgi:hypothetical protein
VNLLVKTSGFWYSVCLEDVDLMISVDNFGRSVFILVEDDGLRLSLLVKSLVWATKDRLQGSRLCRWACFSWWEGVCYTFSHQETCCLVRYAPLGFVSFVLLQSNHPLELAEFALAAFPPIQGSDMKLGCGNEREGWNDGSDKKLLSFFCIWVVS